MRVLVLSGSLRRDSWNSRLADWIEMAIAGDTAAGNDLDAASVVRLHLSDVVAPYYDADLEQSEGLPDGPARFADELDRASAMVIVSPEYNASIPGTLKNSIDWVSRLRPQPFDGVRGLLASASPSIFGGNRGLWALRVPLEQLGVHVYPDMFSLSHAHEKLNSDDFFDTPSGERLLTLTQDFLLETRLLNAGEATNV